jgi:hypothetical protein
MLPLSLCRLWQPDRAANAAQDSRSYTTAWGTISMGNPVHLEQHICLGAKCLVGVVV